MEDFSVQTSPTFLDGLLATIAAIPDAWLVIEGSDCVYEQPHRGLTKHDWMTDFIHADGRARLASSGTEHVTAALGTERMLLDRLREVVERKRPGVLFVAQLLLMKIMGTSLESVCAKVAREFQTPVVPVTTRFLERDTAEAFARIIGGLAGYARRKDAGESVALIGYPFNRREGDCLGDIAQLRGILADIGLKPGPLWFDGSPSATLLDFDGVGLIGAFPQAQGAAEALASSVGLAPLSLPLPLGLAATEAFVRALGAHSAREAEVERYVDGHLAKIVPGLDRVISRLFNGRRVLLIAEPALAQSMGEFLVELGFDLRLTVTRSIHPPGTAKDAPSARDVHRLYNPSYASLAHHVETLKESGGLDLIIGSSWERDAVRSFDIPYLEFGFPSILHHPLAPCPTLGFTGVRHLVDRLSALLLEQDYVRSRTRFP